VIQPDPHQTGLASRAEPGRVDPVLLASHCLELIQLAAVSGRILSSALPRRSFSTSRS